MDDLSYGIVPVNQVGDQIEVFILKHLSGHWGFPKGHPNNEENPLDAASRELFEETHLEVDRLLSDQILEENYSFRQNGMLIRKKVCYYIASVKDPLNVIIGSEEASEGKWVLIDEAPMHLTFEEAKRICRSASQHLRGKK